MAIDLDREEVRPLSGAAAWVPCFRKGTKASRKTAGSTLWRWGLTGLAGVTLETVFIGDTRCTSREALQRFFRAVTEARSDGTKPAGSDRTPARRLKESEKAAAEFEAAGSRPGTKARKVAAK